MGTPITQRNRITIGAFVAKDAGVPNRPPFPPPTPTPNTQRIFEVVDLQTATVTFKFGTFCHWTLEGGDEQLEETVAKFRTGKVKGAHIYKDTNGFEHITGLHKKEVSRPASGGTDCA